MRDVVWGVLWAIGVLVILTFVMDHFLRGAL